ncbi:MAG: hypothetical protein KJ561_05415 [Nanoarchaeota archaeon]|nr:hypothetical protein [Nanoarchaeota archaeon]
MGNEKPEDTSKKIEKIELKPEILGKLKWCLNKEKGIKVTPPNENLSSEYIKEADETLGIMMSIKGKWKAITAYYACYNALYAILMKAGIKSEIHECSIGLMNLIKEFGREDIILFVFLKKARIDAQYYLKEVVFNKDNEVKKFVNKCKQILLLDISYIQEEVKKIQNEEK